MTPRSRQASATAAMLAVLAGLTVLTAFTLLAG
jgi:hypothetical protein